MLSNIPFRLILLISVGCVFHAMALQSLMPFGEYVFLVIKTKQLASCDSSFHPVVRYDVNNIPHCNAVLSSSSLDVNVDDNPFYTGTVSVPQEQCPILPTEMKFVVS